MSKARPPDTWIFSPLLNHARHVFGVNPNGRMEQYTSCEVIIATNMAATSSSLKRATGTFVSPGRNTAVYTKLRWGIGGGTPFRKCIGMLSALKTQQERTTTKMSLNKFKESIA
ncbi:MAG: hypothetical protein ACKVRP_02480 [Bacteroidota bacterium]